MTEQREPFELLSMLGARAPNIYGGGRGGVPQLTAQDVSAALSGHAAGDPERLRKANGPTLLVLAKYAHDAQAIHRLQYVWWLAVVGMAVDQEWHLERHVPRTRYLAEATLTEYLCGALCRTCAGTGVTLEQQLCETCGGAKIEIRKPYWWARALKIGPPKVVDWIPRTRQCIDLLQEWESSAESALRAGLKPGVYSE